MAGIAGLLTAKTNREDVERMLTEIAHRGPDDIQAHQTNAFCGGVRSSELSAGRGNGFAQDGDLVVLLDGEIYNDRDGGAADAEVVLKLFQQYGGAFAGHLQGVFACAVCSPDEVLLARDPVGVRPVYYGTTQDGGFCFASEAKALVGVSEDVTEVLPATTVSSKAGVAGYLPIYPAVQRPTDLDEAIQAVRKVMMDAVARRLEDGAVGACLLSGGLDSSIIAAAAKSLGADLPLVTVGMEGAPDVENARIMADHLGLEHHVLMYEADEICQAVPQAVWALESFDEDCVSGAISNLFASKKATEFTNCILSGEGGDELFGGYHLLKDLPSDNERLKTMVRLIEIAYNTAVQRLDRAMMANVITYRTPFIDTHVIALAQQLPVRWKIHDAGDGTLVEKFILREAFKDLLPETIYRRRKLRFAAGTGTDDLMDEIARDRAGVNELADDARTTAEGYVLSSPKELWYYNLFKEKFPAACFERLVGRWDPNK